MTVNSINNNKIRVTLSFEERFRLFGETEDLSLEDPAVRMALRILFKKIKYEYRFLHNCSRVYVDLYKGNSGGFIIYLTKHTSSQEPVEKTFVFATSNHLLDAVCSIRKITQKYSVFCREGRFYLKLDSDVSSKLTPLVEEFYGALAAVGPFDV